MKIYALARDCVTVCVAAKAFPDGIGEAFSTLIQKIPDCEQRTFFGISYMDNEGNIIYKAAAKAHYKGEGEEYDCETFTIPRGQYITETITNWKKDETSIGKAFRRLTESRHDATFPCVEWYKGADVMCMVKLEK